MQRLFLLYSFYFICSLPCLVYGQAPPQISNQPRAYYVSTTGRDDNPGTKTQPFKSIVRVNRLAFSAGDTLCFKANEAFSGTLQVNLTATAEKPFLITSYDGGRATINAGQKKHLFFTVLIWFLKILMQKAGAVRVVIQPTGFGSKGMMYTLKA